VLSQGRALLGVGAAWYDREHAGLGVPFPPTAERFERLEETLQIVTQMWSPDDNGPYTGTHYQLAETYNVPPPPRGRVPILIGGGGPRVLRIAGREADIVGVNPSLSAGVIDQSTFATATAESTDEKLAIVREAAGERLDRIELNVRTFMVMVTDDVSQSLDALASFAGSEPEAVNQSPYALVGPPSKLVEDLLARRERWGFSYVIIGQSEVEAFAPVVAELAGR